MTVDSEGQSSFAMTVGNGLLGIPLDRSGSLQSIDLIPAPSGNSGLGDMIQYTCDQCGRMISGQRFSVKIEIRRESGEAQLTAADLDQDNLQQIADEISQMDSTSEFQLPEPKTKAVRLDLCSGCTRRFEKDPLARDTHKRFNISPN